MAIRLGKLEQMDPHFVWNHEAHDFIPWLLEKQERLSEALGLTRRWRSMHWAPRDTPAMPPNGTIDFRFRVRRESAEQAVAELSRAGFLTRSEGQPDDADHVVVASRHVGVPAPDAEVQTAHQAAAAAVLTAAGIQAEAGGMGLTFQGHTNPALAVGMLRRYDDSLPDLTDEVDRHARFLGSCFALWHVNTLVTAAHCVEGSTAEQLCVHFPHGERLYPAASVAVHTEADLAVVRLGHDVWPQQVEAFQSIDSQSSGGPGADFMAYGFPESVFGDSPAAPTARVFKGHYQRLFFRASHMGYRYMAGEVNIPIPEGLSGGPFFVPLNPSAVSGVAVENHKSHTVPEWEEIESNGETRRIEHRQIIQYGIAVMLPYVQDWLAEVIAPGVRWPDGT